MNYEQLSDVGRSGVKRALKWLRDGNIAESVEAIAERLSNRFEFSMGEAKAIAEIAIDTRTQERMSPRIPVSITQMER